MSIPQCHADEADDGYLTLVEFEPGAKQQPADLGDDYDPEAAIALLRQFSDEPSEDPEADWAEFLAFALGIDEDRDSGRKLFDTFLSE